MGKKKDKDKSALPPSQGDKKDLTFDKLSNLMVCVCLILIIFAIYFQVKDHEFVNFDDDLYVTQNAHVQQGLTADSISWAFSTGHSSNWHPLTWMSHMLDCELFGLNPGIHHLINVFIHITNTLLLFLVFRKMTNGLWQSAFVAALFAVHPLHVESVAWIAERKDILSTFFWFLTTWAYVRYVKHPGIKTYIPVFLFLALGLMAKPMLVTLPFVLLLMDYWPLNRLWTDQSFSALRLATEKLPLLALAGISCIITYTVQQKGGALRSLDMLPFDVRVFNALNVYVLYIVQMICPVNLAVYYPQTKFFVGWQVAASFILLCSITWWTFAFRKKRPYLLFGWLWYLGTLVPVIGLVQVGSQRMADRYTHIPLVGLFIMIVWGLFHVAARLRSNVKVAAVGMAATMILILSILSYFQTKYWKDDLSLFGHAIAATDHNDIMHGNLGASLMQRGRLHEAISHFQEALRIFPGNAKPHANMALALSRLGRHDEAIPHYKEALRINPNHPETYMNMGLSLVTLGKIDEGIKALEKAVQMDPENAAIYNNLGFAMVRKGDFEAAVPYFMTALKLDPDFEQARKNLSVAKKYLQKSTHP